MNLEAWLARLEARHAQAIQLGLERVVAVRDAMGLAPDFPIVTVAGTNGKGSTCAFLEAIWRAAGHRVGCYTSPHLLRYNERVRLHGREASDAELVAAFEAVEAARGDTPLTYFEHGTLAALWLFVQAKVDAAVLEVGLGGRLDAVNAFDADVAIVTPIDLDHQDWLGHTREAIGFEKAGIFRPARPAICVDPAPPASLRAHAEAIGARWLALNETLRVEAGTTAWTCRVEASAFPSLPWPSLPGRYQFDNAAAALAAAHLLAARMPVSLSAMHEGIATATLAGRFQVIGQGPLRLVEVGHNPHAARSLATNLAALPAGRRIAVFAALADKDIAGIVHELAGLFAIWHVAPLPGPRATSASTLASILREAGETVCCHDDIAAAWQSACNAAGPADTIAAFGSFLTVAAILATAAS